MREQGNFSRRTIAAAFPLAALAIAPAAAMPAPIKAGDDAALLDLGRRWQAALDAELAQSKTYRDTMSRAEALAHEAVGDRLHTEASALFDEIMRTPATTPAGLAVKARILAYENDVQMPDEASVAEALLGAHYLEDRAAFSLALDVLRMARSAS